MRISSRPGWIRKQCGTCKVHQTQHHWRLLPTPVLLVQSPVVMFQHGCSCFPPSAGTKWLSHSIVYPWKTSLVSSREDSAIFCTQIKPNAEICWAWFTANNGRGPYDLCRSRGSTQSSCQESVSLLGKCCVVSEEGRRYKIPLQALVWRNSEPKSGERLERRRREDS
ncbi:corticoliberin isoform X2 [Panthera tigris]|uniref:corticoliberin isoform X2 n=1 Tax=Panthera tigris TaxID=9694 RepID=UPI001C6F83DC|nr:corticoliberin isoform X2 [Panthera tigris]